MKQITKTFFKNNFPLRAKNSYKNLNGKVFIAAGSADMPGAAVLCARAAYRAGAGFVTIAAPQALYSALAAAAPEALVLNLPCKKYLDAKALNFILTHIKNNPQDVLLAGPGLGKGAAVSLKLINQSNLPAVIDADALNYLAAQGLSKLKQTAPHILTPHTGEIKRLLGKNKIDPQTAAAQLAAVTNAAALLKGPQTKVSFKGITYANTTGNEGLAKAGSGDALAGIIAGVWAQLIRRETKIPRNFLAALLGVYLHGAAADLAVKEKTATALLATDIIETLPKTLGKIYRI
ncbi:MAG: NAD(P)H-hydrate dehydratase [Elusimicrobiota bacterium]|jgi:NAD(P)H-hydrate epimerase|nr:NAD(P)H-hydrate dehydratase [Elusimicrobiota bacterium]